MDVEEIISPNAKRDQRASLRSRLLRILDWIIQFLAPLVVLGIYLLGHKTGGLWLK